MKQGHFEIAENLILNNADLNSRDEYGYTALLLASERVHSQKARYFLEKGFDVNTKGYANNTALYFATKHGDI